ncbi:MAG TPA: GNAT family N-acetyltransferase [Planctomycetes bacterium]|nr:GNAT family N-acetyltransferase [Planctomycetota bacterium]
MIDAHVHLGDFPEKRYTRENLAADLRAAECSGAVVFAFPEDMYRVEDSPSRRARAHEYILNAAAHDPEIHPFFFVWRYDEVPEALPALYKGVKWHRHSDEPEYEYASDAFRSVAALINENAMPVTLEEERENTFLLLERLDVAPVIIPHCGRMNGGFDGLKPLLDRPNVFFDTSVAPIDEVRTVLDAVGPHRLIFGSDVSGTRTPFFNFPKVELEKLKQLSLSENDWRLVTRENIMRIMGRGKRYQLMMDIRLQGEFRAQPPEGYSIRTFMPGDEEVWADIMNGSIGEWDAGKAGAALFGQPCFDPSAMFFAVDNSTGAPVGSACLWHDDADPLGTGRLHMVAVKEEHRGHRLGETLVTAVLAAGKSRGLERIVLATDDWRVGAVKTYLKLGFEPVLNVRFEDHSPRWAALKKQLGCF